MSSIGCLSRLVAGLLVGLVFLQEVIKLLTARVHRPPQGQAVGLAREGPRAGFARLRHHHPTVDLRVVLPVLQGHYLAVLNSHLLLLAVGFLGGW